jgi:Cu/Ag efflux pump CusA
LQNDFNRFPKTFLKFRNSTDGTYFYRFRRNLSIRYSSKKVTNTVTTATKNHQDWVVRRQLLGTEGVADVASFGGDLKQYEVAINPAT